MITDAEQVSQKIIFLNQRACRHETYRYTDDIPDGRREKWNQVNRSTN